MATFDDIFTPNTPANGINPSCKRRNKTTMIDDPDCSWHEGATSLYDCGSLVIRYTNIDNIHALRDATYKCMFGPEFAQYPCATTLFPSGRQAHPTSFHGAHRVVWNKIRFSVAEPLFTEVETIRLKRIAEWKDGNVDYCEPDEPGLFRISPRFLEMLPGQLVYQPKKRIQNTVKDQWTYETSILAQDDDHIFVGFLNCNHETIYIDVVPGSHRWNHGRGETMSVVAATDMSKNPWILEESGHHKHLTGVSAEYASRNAQRIAIPPGHIFLKNISLVTRPQFMPYKKETLIQYNLAYRLTFMHKPLSESIANELDVHGIPTLYTGRKPSLFAELPVHHLGYEDIRTFQRWTGKPGKPLPSYRTRCLTPYKVTYLKKTKENNNKNGNENDEQAEHKTSVAYIFIPHQVMYGLKEYGLPVLKDYSDAESRVFFPCMLKALSSLYVDDTIQFTFEEEGKDALSGDLAELNLSASPKAGTEDHQFGNVFKMKNTKNALPPPSTLKVPRKSFTFRHKKGSRKMIKS